MWDSSRWMTGVIAIVVILVIAGFSAGLLSQFHKLQDLSEQVTELRSQSAPIHAGVSTLSSASSGVASSASAQASAESSATLTSRLTAIENDVTALTTRVEKLEKNKTGKTSSSGSVRESLLFMGTGSTPNRDWTDVPSTTTVVDTANYSKITEVRFEAALSIVGGEAHARLVDADTGVPFYETELSNNTSTSTWNSAKVLTWPQGTHAFLVQIRSTSGEIAVLNGARIRITVQ